MKVITDYPLDLQIMLHRLQKAGIISQEEGQIGTSEFYVFKDRVLRTDVMPMLTRREDLDIMFANHGYTNVPRGHNLYVLLLMLWYRERNMPLPEGEDMVELARTLRSVVKVSNRFTDIEDLQHQPKGTTFVGGPQ